MTNTHAAPAPITDPETCSWCTQEVDGSTLTELDDGARICPDCLDCLDEHEGGAGMSTTPDAYTRRLAHLDASIAHLTRRVDEVRADLALYENQLARARAERAALDPTGGQA